MSLLDQLHHRGVTTEDLEKAAAVRLFEKAAAAEGVNLDELNEEDVNDLFNHFIAPNQSTKEASAMNDEIVELFEKTAAAEGIDLEDMSDEELAELYNHYVENVLPEQIDAADGEKDASDNDAIVDMFQKTASSEGVDLEALDEDELSALFDHYVENVLPLQIGDQDATDKVADAQEKLAEAEILGRHMARAYVDEMNKVAGAMQVSAAKDLATRATAGGMKGKILKGGAALAATGALAYGGKKVYDRKKSKAEQEKQSSARNYLDDVNAAAYQMLRAAGYDV